MFRSAKMPSLMRSEVQHHRRLTRRWINLRLALHDAEPADQGILKISWIPTDLLVRERLGTLEEVILGSVRSVVASISILPRATACRYGRENKRSD